MLSNLEIVSWLKENAIEPRPKEPGETNKKSYKYVLDNGEVFFIKRAYRSGIEVSMPTRPIVISLVSKFADDIYSVPGVDHDPSDATRDSASFAGFPRVKKEPRGRDFGVSSTETLSKVITILQGKFDQAGASKAESPISGGSHTDDDLFIVDERILREIKTRRGQSDFRDKLLQEYSHTCVVTGSTVISVLEAAHIVPHADTTNYSMDNGLLLRADIHTLFDIGKINITADGVILIGEELRNSEYAQYEGCRISGLISDQKRANLQMRLTA